MTVRPSPHPGVLKIQPYKPGDAEIEGQEQVIKLASNESPFGPSPRVAEAVAERMAALHLYPDAGSSKLCQAIGARYDLPAEQIIVGAGSEQILELTAAGYLAPGDETIYSEYGFLVYPMTTFAAGGVPVKVDEDDFTVSIDTMLAAVTERTKIVFVANPGNPTGTYVPLSEIRRLREGLPADVLLVIDAAYAEYVEREDYSDGHELVAQAIATGADNVMVTRTFSKIYGLAALRVGWAYAPESVIDVLNRISPVFNVTDLSQTAAIAAIGDQEHVSMARRHNNQAIEELSNKINGLGFHVTPSVGNFILVHFPGGAVQSQEVDSYLRQDGIIVRPVGGYGLGQCLRITIGSRVENEALLASLKAYVGD